MPLFNITAEQKHKLLTDGFVLLPGAVPDDLLSHWRVLAREIEEGTVSRYQSGKEISHAFVSEDPVGPRLLRYDDVHETHTDDVLEMLGCPAMMAVARELCGRGVVPLQFDIVYKQQHPHPVINWHQGAPHPRGYPYLNIGIYLDDADRDDGCVRYVPGTQSGLLDIGKLSESHGWEIPGTVEQPAKAGDILVQDMMILHGSPPKRSPGVRRTIYVEMRPAGGVLESGAQSEEWLELRKRWMAMVVRRADPEDWPEEWNKDLPADLGPDKDEIKMIADRREPPIPAVYAIHPVVRPDYPVPADMIDESRDFDQ